MKKEVLVSALIDAKICERSDIQAATLEEVTMLEDALGTKLPAQYREFLLGIGHGAGRFLKGTDIFLPALDGLRDEASDLLSENNEDAELSSDAFVFSMHQGYEFTYFKTSEGDDPPVYQYVEGNGPPALTWNTFNEYLREQIARHSVLSK